MSQSVLQILNDPVYRPMLRYIWLNRPPVVPFPTVEYTQWQIGPRLRPLWAEVGVEGGPPYILTMDAEVPLPAGESGPFAGLAVLGPDGDVLAAGGIDPPFLRSYAPDGWLIRVTAVGLTL